MLIVEIKNKKRLLKELSSMDTIVKFLGGTASGKALSNTITGAILDAIARRWKIPTDTLIYESLKRTLARIKMTQIAALMDETKKGQMCLTLANNLSASFFEIVGEEVSAEVTEMGLGKDSAIGRALNLATKTYVRTASESATGQVISNAMAKMICEMDFKKMAEEQTGGISSLPGVSTLASWGGKLAGMFGGGK